LAVAAVTSLAVVAGCKYRVPLYCDEQTPCEDPERPFCDLHGEYPASEGIAKTCIPFPFDAGVDEPDAGRVADGGLDAAPIADAEPSDNADLAALVLSAPSALSPPFDPSLTTYSMNVSILVQETTVTATLADPTATLRVNATEVESGEASDPIPLGLGLTNLSVSVTAAAGNTKTISIVINRGGDIAQFAYAKASNTDALDEFGSSVAFGGDRLAVGVSLEASSAVGVNPDPGQANNDAVGAGAVYIFRRSGTSWTQEAYVKASNTDGADFFGHSIALSDDTLVVGAYGEDSNATGPNPPLGQGNNSAANAGAVYVFRRNGTNWSQEAYVKASNTDPEDRFGQSVALDGDTLVVGADREASGADGVEPASGQTDNSANGAGAVYVFRRAGTTWTQEAYLKASNSGLWDQFGYAVALSGDTLVVGAFGEDSGATGVDPISGEQDDSASLAGAVYVFRYVGTMWAQEAYIKASNTDSADQFGRSVAASGDTLVVGAHGESSAAAGVSPEPGQNDNTAGAAGAVYVFRRGGDGWAQEAYIKASNPDPGDEFGSSVALHGAFMAVGAEKESSGAIGVEPDPGQEDNTASEAGAVYVFRRTGTTWMQEAYVKASNTEGGDRFGASVGVSGDTVAVIASREASGACGVDPLGGEADNSADRAGALYIFH
jgi:hypothetical protein